VFFFNSKVFAKDLPPCVLDHPRNVYANTHTCTCTHTPLPTACAHTHTRHYLLHVHTYTRAPLPTACAHTHTHATTYCMCTHTHAHAHTHSTTYCMYTHTHTHTHTPLPTVDPKFIECACIIFDAESIEFSLKGFIKRVQSFLPHP
jgi:hypothetical protein